MLELNVLTNESEEKYWDYHWTILFTNHWSFLTFFSNMSLFRGKKKSCLKAPNEIVTHLDEKTLQQLAQKDLKKTNYPIYLICSDPK
jgi:hypothetical protein